jgi:hypothetical protein
VNQFEITLARDINEDDLIVKQNLKIAAILAALFEIVYIAETLVQFI